MTRLELLRNYESSITQLTNIIDEFKKMDLNDHQLSIIKRINDTLIGKLKMKNFTTHDVNEDSLTNMWLDLVRPFSTKLERNKITPTEVVESIKKNYFEND